MPSFRYRATSLSGQLREGVVQATSPAELERALGEQGLLVLEVGQARKTPRAGFSRSRGAEVAEGIRYLATLVEAGFTLERALGTVGGLLGRRDVADAFALVREAVRGGGSLAEALDAQPAIFPRVAGGLARAGERGGDLAGALSTLAAQVEREQQLRSDLAGALLYPLLLIVVGGIAVGVLLLVVLPRFAAMFQDLGAELPASARLLIGAGRWAATWWPGLLALAVVALVAFATLTAGELGRLRLARTLGRLPVIGRLQQAIAASRFGRTLGPLLGTGLPILPALEIAANATGNPLVVAEMRQAARSVSGGETLGRSLQGTEAFPPLFLQMLDLGEEAGRLPAMLARAAEAAEQDLRRGLDRAVRLVEPLLIIVFGIVAGAVALALLQTIYGLRIDLPR